MCFFVGGCVIEVQTQPATDKAEQICKKKKKKDGNEREKSK